MEFKIGHTVAVLDEALSGTISGISGEDITLKDDDGMEYTFHHSEIVIVTESQHQLSKYSDINNPFLKEKAQENRSKKTVFKKVKTEVIFEIDLHIDKLRKSVKGMDNYDILSHQLEVARLKLEFAIRKKISKIVFIHGVGEGILKTELCYLLNKYPVKYYDAPYHTYGLGATEVYIYQNPN